MQLHFEPHKMVFKHLNIKCNYKNSFCKKFQKVCKKTNYSLHNFRKLLYRVDVLPKTDNFLDQYIYISYFLFFFKYEKWFFKKVSVKIISIKSFGTLGYQKA